MKDRFQAKFILVVLVLVAATFKLNAQTPGGCLMVNQPVDEIVHDSTWRTQAMPQTCGDLNTYIKPNTTLTFNVNFHFFRPTPGSPYYNGPKDFYKDVTPDDCDTLLKYVNQRMANFRVPPDCTATPPSNNNYNGSMVQYNLVKDVMYIFGHWVTLPHVFFHENDTAWWSGAHGFYYPWAYNRYAVNPNSEINIFFIADTTVITGGIGNYGYVYMSSFPWTPTQFCPTCPQQTFTGNLAHELGHTAGILGHTNDPASWGSGGSASGVPSTCYFPWQMGTTDYCVEPSSGPCWTGPSVTQGGCASNNIMGYNSDRTYLSPNQLGSFFYSVYCGANAKFVSNPGYSTDRCVYDSSKTININADTTWNSVVVCNGDVVVQPGKVLAIHCTALFASGSRLIIKPTAKVILDGGTLTSLCGFWQGVQVQGNKNASQALLPHVRPAYQGLLIVQNGGAIMNAQVGITTIEKFNNGNQDWNKTGGIIMATNANFTANIKDVEFLWYQNAPSSSYFTNCNFNGNNQPPGGWPDSRVSIYGEKGIRFSGCDFTPNTSGSGALRHNAISARDAGFTVDSLPAQRSTFGSFYYGIIVQNATLFNDPVTVNAADFTVPYTGAIYLSQSNYATLTNNYMRLQYFGSTSGNPNYGVYMNQSTGYSIRKNTLIGSNNGTGFQVGICINNSGSGNNSVYNNSYTKLTYGLNAQEQNQGGSPKGSSGLIMNCNQFSTCTTNVTVTGLPQNAANNGVLAVQGSLSNPALYVRNQYNAPACTAQNLYSITNVTGLQLWHPSFSGLPYQPLPQQSCSDSTKIRLYQLSGTYSSSYCPVSCTGCRTMAEIEQSIRSQTSALAALRSGGDADLRQDAENELIFERAQLGLLSNDRIRQFLNDTSLKHPLDSVISELKQRRNPDYKKQLASVYLQMGNAQLAKDFLDSARADEPANADLYAIGMEAISARANPHAYIAALKNNVVLKNKLLAMANNPLSSGFGQARALLSLAFGTKFPEHWVFDQNQQRAANEISNDPAVRIFPNPAGDRLNIGYLVGDNEEVSVILADVSGRIIRSQKLIQDADLHALDTRDLNNGLYFVTLHSAGHLISTSKVVILK